jgi:hypothetical protein
MANYAAFRRPPGLSDLHAASQRTNSPRWFMRKQLQRRAGVLGITSVPGRNRGLRGASAIETRLFN